jgi:cellulose synthase/poly-beta-1,6-N-acetylglucosamine synthase-like glycosyltransferase
MAEKVNPRIIMAMPAYNEEKYIGTLVLKARKYADEDIVVDDGNTDKYGFIDCKEGDLSSFLQYQSRH